MELAASQIETARSAEFGGSLTFPTTPATVPY
jgi:hypothetical protein